MKHIDYLQITLVANLLAIFIVLITAALLAWNNSGSKNLPLAAAALIGVMVGYTIQLPFELARSTRTKGIGVEITIDRAEPVIRQWVYANNMLANERLVSELAASRWLVNASPNIFDTEVQREKVAKDLIIYNLVSYLTHAGYDWQMQRDSYGSMQQWESTSKPEECSFYGEPELRQQLSNAGNIFSDAPLQRPNLKLCLPPETEMEISADTLTLQNLFCRLTFKLNKTMHAISNVDPKTGSFVPFGDGDGRYQNRMMGLKAETTFFALRAQHRNHKQYEEWASRLVDGLEEWFASGDPRQPPQQMQF